MGKQRRQMLHGRTVVAESGGQQDKKGLQPKEKDNVFFLLAGNFALVEAVQILV